MTKSEKIASLDAAMTVSKRNDDTEFDHFTDTAPKELQDLFLEHFEVRDVDYEIFDRACDIVSEIYSDKPDATEEEATEEIYERASDSANVYTSIRLDYMNMWNEQEISEIMREYDLSSIADACAVWYDRQVEQAATLINEWVNTN